MSVCIVILKEGGGLSAISVSDWIFPNAMTYGRRLQETPEKKSWNGQGKEDVQQKGQSELGPAMAD